MSTAKLAKFTEFQQDFSDDPSSGHYSCPKNDPPSDSLAHEGNKDDWEDEDEAIITGLGFASKSTEWARRIGNEHTSWDRDLSALTDAYLLYRSNAQSNVGSDHNLCPTLSNDSEVKRVSSALINCEQFFSSSNRVAALTRLASPYHRRERIHIHLEAWDEDQHRNIGYLLRSRYQHAVKERDTAEAIITRLKPGVSIEIFEQHIHSEQEYLELGKQPVPEEVFKIEYIGKLKRLRSKEEEYVQCCKATTQIIEGYSIDLRRSILVTSHHESRKQTTLDQLLLLKEEVLRFEHTYGIEHRWTSTSAEWVEAEQLEHNQRFQRVVDELEQLVVQRLFELSRAGLARTGYKLRMHINKSIARRSSALKTALDRYNEVASQLVPPSPTISWKQIKDARILEDFDLIRGSRSNILQQDWTKPENRQCAEQSRRIARAEEEIQRLNVEVRRVRSLIVHEEFALQILAKQITDVDPSLGWAAQRYVDLRLHTNQLVSNELKRLEKSEWYTGRKTVGVPLDTTYIDLIAKAHGGSMLAADDHHVTSQIKFDHYDRGVPQSNTFDTDDGAKDESGDEMTDCRSLALRFSFYPTSEPVPRGKSFSNTELPIHEVQVMIDSRSDIKKPELEGSAEEVEETIHGDEEDNDDEGLYDTGEMELGRAGPGPSTQARRNY
ncbi:hypothetical protein RSOLAG22IIIB_08135 [Rhizoctonia solani]|uniref:Uncharacterized protein n=1 Tax=Rhizoctonia solani TaxID=456999 RepID=A0A0K6FRP2_9AGAM|nr:hypothetical protein RSOLAG22IIIB_08135 [Rhizoctonia solani]